MKYLKLIIPLFVLLPLVGAYLLVHSVEKPAPYVKKSSSEEDVILDADEYYRYVKVKPFGLREVHRLLIRRTRQKEGVYLESLLPVMDSVGLEVVNAYHIVLGDDYVPVITSGNDYAYHVKNSKHYQNKALDFRIKQIPVEDRARIVEILQGRLKDKCRVLWEKGEAEHLHVELLK